MNVSVQISDGPLQAARVPQAGNGVGAVILFEGIVRVEEDGKPLAALDYEAYEPMASKMLHRIGTEVCEKFGVSSMCIEHSRGRVAPGQCSFRLRIESPHRKEGLAAADEFIDRMKKDVPIWKKGVWEE